MSSAPEHGQHVHLSFGVLLKSGRTTHFCLSVCSQTEQVQRIQALLEQTSMELEKEQAAMAGYQLEGTMLQQLINYQQEFKETIEAAGQASAVTGAISRSAAAGQGMAEVGRCLGTVNACYMLGLGQCGPLSLCTSGLKA